MGTLRAVLADTASALAHLVLPATCAGCGAPESAPLCGDCAATLTALRPHATRPTPAPAGLPACFALAGYGGVLRAALLAYKEKNRHDLARPLGALLAQVVAAGAGLPGPVLLVPVPDTARAARARYGDHLSRLARHAATALSAAGWRASVLPALRALPRPDSAGLDSAARAEAASFLRVRRQRVAALRELASSGWPVVLVDDVVTTGATLAAMATRLSAHGVPVRCAAVLAATARRHPPG